MTSTMNPRVLALAQQLKKDAKPQPSASARYVEILENNKMSVAFSNGLSLEELSDFIEKTAVDDKSC